MLKKWHVVSEIFVNSRFYYVIIFLFFILWFYLGFVEIYTYTNDYLELPLRSVNEYRYHKYIYWLNHELTMGNIRGFFSDTALGYGNLWWSHLALLIRPFKNIESILFVPRLFSQFLTLISVFFLIQAIRSKDKILPYLFLFPFIFSKSLNVYSTQVHSNSLLFFLATMMMWQVIKEISFLGLVFVIILGGIGIGINFIFFPVFLYFVSISLYNYYRISGKKRRKREILLLIIVFSLSVLVSIAPSNILIYTISQNLSDYLFSLHINSPLIKFKPRNLEVFEFLKFADIVFLRGYGLNQFLTIILFGISIILFFKCLFQRNLKKVIEHSILGLLGFLLIYYFARGFHYRHVIGYFLVYLPLFVYYFLSINQDRSSYKKYKFIVIAMILLSSVTAFFIQSSTRMSTFSVFSDTERHEQDVKKIELSKLARKYVATVGAEKFDSFNTEVFMPVIFDIRNNYSKSEKLFMPQAGLVKNLNLEKCHFVLFHKYSLAKMDQDLRVLFKNRNGGFALIGKTCSDLPVYVN